MSKQIIFCVWLNEFSVPISCISAPVYVIETSSHARLRGTLVLVLPFNRGGTSIDKSVVLISFVSDICRIFSRCWPWRGVQ